MARLLIVCLLAVSAQAFAQDGWHSFLYEMQLRQALTGKHKKSKPEDPHERCRKIFLEMKGIYDQKVKAGAKKLMVEGMMESSFTREQIETMPNTNRHGINDKVRGTDKVLRKGHSYGHVPPFPHTRPGCGEVFQEEVSVIAVGASKCRQIKFTQTAKPEVVYYQLYCQDSPRLMLSFDPENSFEAEDAVPPKDCVHCQK